MASTRLARRGTECLLPPLRVLDLTDEKGPLCGKILADMGADVIKIERPGGDPARNIGPFYHDIPDPEKSLFWWAYNTGKRSITLDIESSDGQETFKKLVKTSSFVVESFPPGYMDGLGLGYSVLSVINPRIIMASISPFGQTGPYSYLKGPDLVVAAMCGTMYIYGDPDRPPVRMSFPQAYLHASADAAAGCLMAYLYLKKTGKGQHIDVSAQQSQSWATDFTGPFWELNNMILGRTGIWLFSTAAGTRRRLIWPCKDDFVSLILIGGSRGAQTNRKIVEWMLSEGEEVDDFLKNMDWKVAFDIDKISQAELDRIQTAIIQFFMKHTKKELYQGAIERRIQITPVSTPKDIAESVQLAARGYWTELEHPELGITVSYPGHFVLSSEAACEPRSRAPLIGEHNEEIYGKELELNERERGTNQTQQENKLNDKQSMVKPLDGIKVADFAWVATGPTISRCLADYGATVLHIESSTSPDILRTMPPYKDGKPGLNRSGFWPIFNCNKYGVALDLNKPQGAEIARRIALWADVIVESFAPGVIARWGLDYESIRKTKPEIIYLSASQQGQTGPHAKQPGNGAQLAALSGFVHMTGWPDRSPVQPFSAYTDFVVPRFGIAAILAAIDYRDRTGKGQYLDLSQFEAGLHFLDPLLLDWMVNGREATRMGNRSPYGAPHGVYPCRGNDKWIAIAVFNEEEWQSLGRVIGNPALAEDNRFSTLAKRKENEDDLDRLIGAWTSDYAPEQLMARLQRAGVGAGVVQTSKDVHNDPQLKHRHHLAKIEHPEIGLHSCESFAFKLSRSPAQLRMPAPCLGQHTEYVCTHILGMSDEEFVTLMASGVFE